MKTEEEIKVEELAQRNKDAAIAAEKAVAYKKVKVGNSAILVTANKKPTGVTVIFVNPDFSINTQNSSGEVNANVPYLSSTIGNPQISPYPYWRLIDDKADPREGN